MATTPTPFFDPQLLGTSIGTLYTTPASTTSIIKHLALKNVTTGVVEVTIHIVPAGGVAGDANEAFKRKLAGEEDIQVYSLINENLETGATIQALCDTASAVSIRGGGNEVVS
jgi:hypothetical protein